MLTGGSESVATDIGEERGETRISREWVAIWEEWWLGGVVEVQRVIVGLFIASVRRFAG